MTSSKLLPEVAANICKFLTRQTLDKPTFCLLKSYETFQLDKLFRTQFLMGLSEYITLEKWQGIILLKPLWDQFDKRDTRNGRRGMWCVPHAEHVIRSELFSLLVTVAHVTSFLPTAVCCSSAENIRWSKLIDSFFCTTCRVRNSTTPLNKKDIIWLWPHKTRNVNYFQSENNCLFCR